MRPYVVAVFFSEFVVRVEEMTDMESLSHIVGPFENGNDAREWAERQEYPARFQIQPLSSGKKGQE